MNNEFSFEPIHTEPAYRVAAQAIREKIMAGEIEVGAALPSEMAMSELLRVNRSTVREAIRLLEENGILTRKPGGKKLLVSVPSGADLSRRVTTAMLLQKITVRELWEAMIVFEPAIAAAAANSIGTDEIARLERNLSDTETHVDDRQSIVVLDIEFHELIAAASGNRALQLSRQPLGELFYPAFDAVFQRLNAGERLLRAHREIVDGLKAHDVARSRDWMQKHIVDFRRGYELAGLDLESHIKGSQ